MNIARNIRRNILKRLGGYYYVDLDLVGQEDQWACNPNLLQPDSVVISGGVGHSISFEKELIDRVGCNVHIFDPSPTGIETMKKGANTAKEIIYYPCGLAGRDGFHSFGLPDRADEGSWRKESRSVGASFQCRSIPSLVREQQWRRVNLLKLDIEGFEYDVIKNIISSDIEVDQLCVEFHTKAQISISETAVDLILMIFRLRRNGFRLVNLRHADFTFLHERVL